ncbi:hypothetical protein [Actinophytocola sp.]|uniref:hypothetical protein n=1 Tax=Actinophytocola sp. TaxID=1872138 RepID=UPI003D6B8C21
MDGVGFVDSVVIVGLVLVVVGLVVLVLAVREVRRLRADVVALEERAGELAGELGALPPELSRSFGTGARHLISVEILNLFELAHKESVLTRPFTALTPRLLRDVVHRRIVGRVRQSLDEQGVRADVRLHRAR